ncbi:MAG: glycosyltransferase [Thermodesulforhabdaceae bacterium]
MGSESSKKRARCSIIIPVFNKVDLTKQCVDALLKHISESFLELIIVDDHSSDGTANYLKYLSKRYPFIKTLRNERNRGFSYTCNRGASIAKGDYLVFLNNDTIPLPGWLEALVEVAEKDEKIAVVGAKLLYPNGTIQHAGVTFQNLVFPVTPMHIYHGSHCNFPYANVERDYDAVTGACILVRKKVFEEIGRFDESFVTGYEDMDFCLKVREAGYRVVYTPKSVLYHFVSSSPGRFDHEISNVRIFNSRWIGKVNYAIKREPRVSIIIVNYNGWNDTLEALSSLFIKERYERFNVIIVDNASKMDRSEEIKLLCNKFRSSFFLADEDVSTRIDFNREVFVKKLDTNKGFGGGCNEGIKMALSWGADYVWLLNNDTLIGDLALYYLISAAEQSLSVAIVGSKLHCYPEIEKVQFDGISVSYRGIKSDSKNREQLMNVDAVCGASMLIRADFLRVHGLLREDYFLYFEDNEICRRALLKGLYVMYNPLSVVYHKGGGSIGEFMESPNSIYYGIRNALFFHEEFMNNKISEVLNLLESSMFPKLLSEGNKDGFYAATQAIYDFLMDKRGARCEETGVNDKIQEFSETGFSDYNRLCDYLLRLRDSILNSPGHAFIIRVYFDTLKTLVFMRQSRKLEVTLLSRTRYV